MNHFGVGDAENRGPNRAAIVMPAVLFSLGSFTRDGMYFPNILDTERGGHFRRY